MTTYALRRLIEVAPVLLAVSAIVFLLVRWIPGDTALLIAGENASPEVVAAIRQRIGLDRPLVEQYVRYVGDVVTGDLGTSIRSHRPVASELLLRLPNTVALALASLVIFAVAGTLLGIVAAVAAHRTPDHIIRITSVVGISSPEFVIGAVLIIVFAVQLGWLPVAGSGSWRHLVLPAVTAAVGGLAITARVVRTSLLEVLGHDFVRTARAKGVGQVRTVMRHALRNAAIPAVTLVGLEFGRSLGGLVVVETVFAWPGLGKLLIDSIGSRDYPVVQSLILVFALTLIVVNLVVDLLIGVLDPRVRYT